MTDVLNGVVYILRQPCTRQLAPAQCDVREGKLFVHCRGLPVVNACIGHQPLADGFESQESRSASALVSMASLGKNWVVMSGGLLLVVSVPPRWPIVA